MSATCIGALQRRHEMMMMLNACDVRSMSRYWIAWNLWLFYKVVYVIQEHVLGNYHHYFPPCKSTWTPKVLQRYTKVYFMNYLCIKKKWKP
jgi:L-asparagine transporter-like permease